MSAPSHFRKFPAFTWVKSIFSFFFPLYLLLESCGASLSPHLPVWRAREFEADVRARQVSAAQAKKLLGQQGTGNRHKTMNWLGEEKHQETEEEQDELTLHSVGILTTYSVAPSTHKLCCSCTSCLPSFLLWQKLSQFCFIHWDGCDLSTLTQPIYLCAVSHREVF